VKKITIEYNIESSFDEEEVRRAINSTDAYLALFDVQEMLKGDYEGEDLADKLRTELWNILDKRGINLSRDLS
jgi:hypothetical protein